MLKSLKTSEWPVADRLAWQAALQPRVGWRQGGAASKYRESTQNDLERRYGYFLKFCGDVGELDLAAACAAHVTEANVIAYVAHAKTIWASVTLYGAVHKLEMMARMLAPASDFDWLHEIVLDLKAMAEPSIRRETVLAERLMKLGLNLHEQGMALIDADKKKGAKLIRDGMIIAMLAACPIRAKNFSALELGRSIKCEHGQWWIVLEGAETKNGLPDMRPIPDYLLAPLEGYLLHARPVLMNAAQHVTTAIDSAAKRAKPSAEVQKAESAAAPITPNADQNRTPAHNVQDLSGTIWFSCFGRALDIQSLHIITTSNTLKAFGIAVNPHAFRSSAATTAAWQGSKTPYLASALLQHKDKRTVDAHYNRATTFEAAKEFGKMIRDI